MWWVPKGWAGNVLENRPFGKCQLSQPPKVWAGNVLSVKSLGMKCPEHQKSGHEMSWIMGLLESAKYPCRQKSGQEISWEPIVPTTKCLVHEISQPPIVSPPKVHMPNVVVRKCPKRKKSKRQLSETPNVRREMFWAGIVPAAKCLKRQLSEAPNFQAPNAPAPRL